MSEINKKYTIKRFYTQQEAAKILNTTPRMLIYWEKHLFPKGNFVKKSKRHRVYTQDDIARLKIAFLLLDQGWDSANARDKLHLMKKQKIRSLKGLYWDIREKMWITKNEIIKSYMQELLPKAIERDCPEEYLIEIFFQWIEKS